MNCLVLVNIDVGGAYWGRGYYGVLGSRSANWELTADFFIKGDIT